MLPYPPPLSPIKPTDLQLTAIIVLCCDSADSGMKVYAVLREDWTTGGGHTVCAGSSDIADAGLIYTSSSNVVEARLVTQTTRQLAAQFLIKVERNAAFMCI